MLATRLLVRMFLVCLMVLAAAYAHGQNFPNKTIRIVTTEPGSTSDFLARLIAQGITGGLGRQVIVENKGGGMLASDAVLRGRLSAGAREFARTLSWERAAAETEAHLEAAVAAGRGR